MPTWYKCRKCRRLEDIGVIHKCKVLSEFFFRTFDYISFRGYEGWNITYSDFHNMYEVPTFPLVKHFMAVRRGGEKVEHKSFVRAAQRVYYLLNPHFHLISLTLRRSAPGDLVHGANVPVSPVPEEEDIEDISTPSIPHIPESSPVSSSDSSEIITVRRQFGDDLGRCSPEGLDVSTIPSTSRAGVTPSSSTLEEIVPAKEESSDSDSETLATIRRRLLARGSSTGLEEAVVTEPSSSTGPMPKKKRKRRTSLALLLEAAKRWKKKSK